MLHKWLVPVLINYVNSALFRTLQTPVTPYQPLCGTKNSPSHFIPKRPQHDLFRRLTDIYTSHLKLNQQYCYQFLNTWRTKQGFLNSVATLTNLTRLNSALFSSNMCSVILKIHSYLDMSISFMLRRWMIQQVLTQTTVWIFTTFTPLFQVCCVIITHNKKKISW